MSSEKQLAANRANAQHSTGPASSEGKAEISHNALKTGLTGRTVLLPSEDVAAYQAHQERVFKQFAPEADEEKRLTRSLTNTLWRLERIPSLEAGIYAIGRRELAAQFADEQDEAELKRSIAERKEAIRKQEADERARWINASEHLRAARRHRIPFDPADIGFEFQLKKSKPASSSETSKASLATAVITNTDAKGTSELPQKLPDKRCSASVFAIFDN